MLKWFLISIGVIIVIIGALVGTLYYLIFYKEVALARPITYESEEQAVASAISDMLSGLLGITLTEDQETELEELVSDYAAGDADLDDIQAFIFDETTGVMATNTISLSGGLGVQITETQVTALINLLIGNIDTILAEFTDEAISGLSSENGALTYTIEGFGDVKLSGIGVNINEGSIAIVFTVTLPEDLPYVGFILGGQTISLGLNPLITVEEDGTIVMDVNLDGVQIGGISSSFPGFSYATNYLKNMLGADMLQYSFNPTALLESTMGIDLGLEFTLEESVMSFTGPPTIASTMREIDLTAEEQDALAAAAEDEIQDFIDGLTDELVLTEEELTALLAENIETALEETPDIDIDLEGFTVNIDEEGLSIATTVTIPEDTELDLPDSLLGAEVEIGLITDVVIDEDGNASLEITGLDLGGLPDEVLEEFGLDTETMNELLGDSGIDLAEALGLTEGELTDLSLTEGTLTLE